MRRRNPCGGGWKEPPACGTEAVHMNESGEHKPTVERYAEAELPSRFGPFRVVVYREVDGDKEHLAVIAGEVEGAEDLLILCVAIAGTSSTWRSSASKARAPAQ